MKRHANFQACVGILLLSVGGARLCAAPIDTPIANPALTTLAKGFPKDALFFGEVHGLKALKDHFPVEAWKKVVENSKQFRDYRKSADYDRLLAGIKITEAIVGYDLNTLADKLSDIRIAAALYPSHAKRKEPDWIVTVYYPDKQLWNKLRTQIESLATLAAGGKAVRESRGGRQTLTINDSLHFFTERDVFVGSNRKELLDGAGLLLAGKRADSLANDAGFQNAVKRTSGNLATLYLDNAKTRAATKDGRWAPAKMDNFLGTMLLQDALELAVTSDHLAGAVDVNTNGLKLSFTAPGDPNRLGDAFRGFFLTPSQAGSPPFPKIDGFLSGVTLHRNISELYNQREKLVIESILPDFDKFESGVNNVLPGKNFAEDLLPMLGKQITIIAANSGASDSAARPAVVLPSSAMIIELADPKKGSEFFTLFFQAIVPIINFTAKESGNKPQILVMETHNGVPMTYARFLEEPKGDKLPISANFQAASATVGANFILASNPMICRQVIDALQTPPVRVIDGRNLVWTLVPESLALSLQKNLEVIVAQQVREGRKYEEAKRDLEMFLAAVRTLSSVELSTQVKSDEFRILLEVRWP